MSMISEKSIEALMMEYQNETDAIIENYNDQMIVRYANVKSYGEMDL